MGTVRQASAGFDCSRHPCLGLICRHTDVDVGPATPRLGRVEGFERHVWITPVPIDDVFLRPKAPVPENGRPERADVAACVLCDGNADDLHLGSGSSLNRRASAERGVPLDVAMAQSAVFPGGGADCDALGPDVHIGEVAHFLRNFGDRGHEPCRLREGLDTEEGVGAGEEDPPLLDSVGGVEGSRNARQFEAHQRCSECPAATHGSWLSNP